MVVLPISYAAFPSSLAAMPTVRSVQGVCVLVSVQAVVCSPDYQVVLPNQAQAPPAILLRRGRPTHRFLNWSTKQELLILGWGPAGHGG